MNAAFWRKTWMLCLLAWYWGGCSLLIGDLSLPNPDGGPDGMPDGMVDGGAPDDLRKTDLREPADLETRDLLKAADLSAPDLREAADLSGPDLLKGAARVTSAGPTRTGPRPPEAAGAGAIPRSGPARRNRSGPPAAPPRSPSRGPAPGAG